jgi:hypothetical protein
MINSNKSNAEVTVLMTEFNTLLTIFINEMLIFYIKYLQLMLLRMTSQLLMLSTVI